MRLRWAAVAFACAFASAVAFPVQLAAQQMRDFTTSRQLHGESRLVTRLEFAAGSLRLLPGPRDNLYRMRLTYDADRFIPLSRFDAAAGAVRLGLENSGRTGLRVSSRGHLDQSATITLSPAVMLGLDLALGAVDADLELGGLRLGELRMKTGASRSVVRFSQPNRARCSSAAFEAGAAEIALLLLGNSRCETISFEGGMGTATIDLSGRWTSNATIRISMTAGGLTLRLPRDLGIRVRMARFLSSFPADEWTRQGDSYLSPGYAETTRRVDIDLSTTLGDVNVEWLP